jgi:radical SAM superfamily enzyme YgiQ (UPF0313 family)
VRSELNWGGCIVLGGPQISYALPAELRLETTYPDADIFVRGYGEESLAAILQQGVAGASHRAGVFTPRLHATDDGAVGRANLELLPSPILRPSGDPLAAGELGLWPFTRWETSRGCPSTCAFCQLRDAAGGALGKRMGLPIGRVLAEARALADGARAGLVRSVAVVDPTFNAGATYKRKLRELVAARFAARISLQARLEMLDDESVSLVRALRDEAGASPVLEFGVQTIHAAEGKAVDRLNNFARVGRALRLLEDARLPFELSVMYGLPLQTLASFEATLQWAEAWSIDRMAVQSCVPGH